MTARDVILTAYACSSQAPCSQWAKDMFEEEPIVLAVPGSGASFLKKGRQWSATGDAFRAALRELAPQYKDVEIRRRALVTFSAGWQLTHNILLAEKEQELLDVCILEDGLHTSDLDHWVNFATRAANSEAWMVMAHSQIIPPFVSSKITNEEVFERASVTALRKYDRLPDYITKPELPTGGVHITVSSVKDATGKVVMPAQTKVWDKDCLVSWDNRGELFILEYEGDDRPDHIYIAWQTAPRIWRMLADYWNRPEGLAQEDAPPQI